MHSKLARAGVFGAIIMGVCIGCTSMNRPSGIHVVPIPHGVRTVTRYGIVHEVPRAPKLKFFSAEGTNALYEAPFEIAYTWARPHSVGDGGFELFFPRNRIADASHRLTRESVEVFVRAKRDPAPHVIDSVVVESDTRFADDGFHFVMRKHRTNPGDLGFVQLDEGYVFIHPYDPECLVVAMFGDFFDPAQNVTPDMILRDIAEEWFRSIRIELLTDEEKAYMRQRDWKWVPLDGSIPKG